MGTNFYWRAAQVGRSDLKSGDHIGKRSAAGGYCWNCHQTLAIGGLAKVHHGQTGQLDECPQCGTARESRAAHNPAMIELGFQSPATKAPTGVQGASSFSWAVEPEEVLTMCRIKQHEETIEDEYGERLTGRAFLVMLDANCPIWITHSIGEIFS